MSRVARATTFVILAGLASGGAALTYRVLRPAHQGGSFHTYVYFRDAKGLPIGSVVKIAGIVVGEIESLGIENGQARVGLRLRDDVVLWDDAWAEKKAASPLSDNYLELSPGGPEPGASPAGRRQLRSGEPIARVLETSTTDKVLRGLEQSIPRAMESLDSADEMAEFGRQWVAGPLSERLARLDHQLDTGELAAPLRGVAADAERLDRALAGAQERVHGLMPRAASELDALAARTASAAQRIAAARAELQAGMSDVRTGLDRADDYADQASTALAALAEPDPAKQGRLAKLIADPGLADELATTTTELAAAAHDLDRLSSTVGLRAEFNVLARAQRFLVSAEIATGSDAFYLIEIEKGPWGGLPTNTLTSAPDGSYTRQVTIAEASRFTAQWGRRFGPLALRAGLKESMFGVGVDATFGNGRLRLSLDAMESNFAHVPRLKMVAALAVFRSIYILGGVDDALSPGRSLPIGASAPEPHTFERLRYGRDYLLGFELRFDDRDASALLRLYGAFLATLFK